LSADSRTYRFAKLYSIPAHTILKEARQTLILIEHDPLLCKDAEGMIDLASQAMSDAAKEAAVML
jgi:hypothetical protein